MQGRINKEIARIQEDEGVKEMGIVVTPKYGNIYDLEVHMPGPEGSFYSEGLF